MDHLKAKQTNEDGTTRDYSRKVDESKVHEAETELKYALKEGLDNEILSKDEFNARPICSSCGSTFENTSAFVQHHIKDLATKHKSYIQDTPDFIRHIEKLNESESLPDNAMLVTIDVKALFTNISHKEGTKCVKEALDVRKS
jgi:methanogenic corrinoid protein MtbC1